MIWPTFLCYRRQDGERHARWLAERLEQATVTLPDGSTAGLRVYLDTAAAATSDWCEDRDDALHAARAMVVVATPGLATDFRSSGSEDWAHHELEWWVRHRAAPPILVDTTGDERFVPAVIRRRWPQMQRVPLDLTRVEGPGGAAEARRLVDRVVAGIVASEDATRLEDLTRARRRVRVLGGVLSLAVLAFVLAAVQAWRADVERTRVFRLSAFETLEELHRRIPTLHPPDPGRIDEYRAWIDEARALGALIEDGPDGTPSALRRDVAALEGLDEPDRDERWWLQRSRALVAEIDALFDPRIGPLLGRSSAHGWGVERLADWIDEVAASDASAESQALWRDAADGVAAAYDGLALSPRFGLRPLGPDPRSGLWEFAHLQTGDVPVRDPSTGLLRITDSTGVVLVLVPAGRLAPRGGPDVPGSDKEFEVAVPLEPFLISKFELTQAQWARLTGTEPSAIRSVDNVGRAQEVVDHQGYSAMYPVEQVSWEDGHRVLRSAGLTLPTEAQWEHACRAGTRTAWASGDEAASLTSHANLADLALVDFVSTMGRTVLIEAGDDGWAWYAPVGTFAPNDFGLHDMHGNVNEWVLDAYDFYGQASPRPGDGLREPAGRALRVFRGGSFLEPAYAARSGNRRAGSAQAREDIVGLRPARPVHAPVD